MVVRCNDQVVGKLTGTGLPRCTYGPSEEAVTKARVGASIQQHRKQHSVDDEPSG